MKVSFDFDGTLGEHQVRKIAKSMVLAGHDVYVVTRRDGPPVCNRDLEQVCKEVGIDLSKVFYTSQSLKGDTLKTLGIEMHFDDDHEEIEYGKTVHESCFFLYVDPSFSLLRFMIQNK